MEPKIQQMQNPMIYQFLKPYTFGDLCSEIDSTLRWVVTNEVDFTKKNTKLIVEINDLIIKNLFSEAKE
jgi:hypothetical protein